MIESHSIINLTILTLQEIFIESVSQYNFSSEACQQALALGRPAQHEQS